MTGYEKLRAARLLRRLEKEPRILKAMSNNQVLILLSKGCRFGGRIAYELSNAVFPVGAAVVGLPILFYLNTYATMAELPLWTAGATVGLIPYMNRGLNHWYCTPNKLWEYPSAGVPVLASPFPEMMKLIQAHGFGWALAPNWDAAGLAAQVAACGPKTWTGPGRAAAASWPRKIGPSKNSTCWDFTKGFWPGAFLSA